MTMPSERARALLWAGEFLREVSRRPDVPADLKNQALVILRHYPEPYNIEYKARQEHAADGPASSWLAPVELLEKSPSPGGRGSLHP